MTQYFRKIMNIKNNLINFQKAIFFGVLLVFGLLVNYSCEEDPSALGSNLLPDSDKVKIYIDTTIILKGRVFKNDPINTSNKTHYSLGILKDEYFGEFKGEFAGQFLPLKKDTNIIDYDIDSAILYVSMDSIFGFRDNNVSFNIFELSKDIEVDTFHLSDHKVSDYYTGQPVINTGSRIQGDSLIVLPLNSDFIGRLKADKEPYRSDSAFLVTFKGLSIVPVLNSEPGTLVYAYIGSTKTKLVIYYNYNDEDSLKTEYLFYKGFRFGQYTHDYSSGSISGYLNNSDQNYDSLLFIQGLAGVSSKLIFPDLTNIFKGDSVYSILSAKIEVPVSNSESDLFLPPDLTMYFADNDSNLFTIKDASDGFIGGKYNEESKNYNFDISRHFMEFVNGEIEDSCLNFGISSNTLYPYNSVLKTGNNIKFKVTYTKH